MQRLAPADLTIKPQARVGLVDRDGLALQPVAHPEIDIVATGLAKRGQERHGGRLQRALLDRCAAKHAPASAEPPHPAGLVLDCKAAGFQGSQQPETRGTGAARLLAQRRERRRTDARQRLQQVKRAAYRSDAIVPRGSAWLMRPVAGAG